MISLFYWCAKRFRMAACRAHFINGETMAQLFQRSFTLAPGIRLYIGDEGKGGKNHEMAVFFGDEGAMAIRAAVGLRPKTTTVLPVAKLGKTDPALDKKVKAVRKSYARNPDFFARDYGRAIDAGLHQEKRIPARIENPKWQDVSHLIVDPMVLPGMVGTIGWAVATVTLLILGLETDYGLPLFTACFGAALFTVNRMVQTTQRNKKEREEVALYDKAAHGEGWAIEEIFVASLSKGDWFDETIGSLETDDEGRKIVIEISLPRADKMPGFELIYDPDEKTLANRKKDGPELSTDYALCVHSTLLRIAGICFALFPTVENVTIDGFVKKDAPEGEEETRQSLIRVDFDRAGFEALGPTIEDSPKALDRFGPERRLGGEGEMCARQENDADRARSV